MKTLRRLLWVAGFLFLTSCHPSAAPQVDPDPPQVNKYWLPLGSPHDADLVCDTAQRDEPIEGICKTVADVRLFLRTARADATGSRPRSSATPESSGHPVRSR